MSNTNSPSFGTSIGRGIGFARAHCVNAAIASGVAATQFGKDVAAGQRAGYADNTVRLAALRAARKAATPLAIETVPSKRRAPAKA